MGSRMGRWFILVAGSLTCLDAAQATANSALGSTQAGPLSFEFFKIRVQPIFLKERQGHARCYGCHTLENRIFHLEPLSSGQSDWSEEQSKINFESASHLVVPGDPNSTTNSSPKLKISMTKDQLKNAPNFEPYKEPNRATTGTGGGAPRPGGMSK